MRLAASQIAWEPAEEAQALDILRKHGFAALEMAPTRVAGENPYADPQAAADFAAGMRRAYNLAVCSMQSIWFGQQGSIFGPERDRLLEYTKRAVVFAEAAGCGNLVFGCPKNRVLPDDKTPDDAVAFFKELGDFAHSHGAVLALEANPPLYGTNFINTTPDAFAMVEQVDSPGFMVNLDVGTMVENGEDAASLRGRVGMIHHVHVSEPNLVAIEKRELHGRLAALLRDEGYTGCVSIEMKAQPLSVLDEVAAYVAEVFR